MGNVKPGGVMTNSVALIFAIMLYLSAMNAMAKPDTPQNVSGVYPHLTMYNNEGECGTGAVVPWAGRLWAIL